MDNIPIILHKILSQSATVHIYSFPYFTLETFLAMVIFIIYWHLHVEITHIGKITLRLHHNTVYFENPLRESFSKDSVSSSITHIQQGYRSFSVSRNSSTESAYSAYKLGNCNTHSQLEWVMSHTTVKERNARVRIDENRKRYAETLATLAPSEFVRKEKEKIMRERGLLKNFESLSTLQNNLAKRKLSLSTLITHVELAREQAQCKTIIPADALTKSLFDLLENIVCTSSLSNQIPFRGDITSLALDAGYLTIKHNTSCDRKIALW